MKKKSRLITCQTWKLGILLILSYSCNNNDDNNKSTLPIGQIPVLTTSDVTNLTQTTATCGGYITSDGGLTITDRGVCWSIGSSPTVIDNLTSDGIGAGGYISKINNLSPNTAYFVRSYATNNAGTGYGSAMSFKTLEEGEIVIDIDGNVYNTVRIGNDVWMKSNLKVTHFRNGDPMPNVNVDWFSRTGAYCNFNNDSTNVYAYGRLYNWYAVNDSRNIAPNGWHVATDFEWETMTDYLGGKNIAGGKLKEAGYDHWSIPNTEASNSSGFTALPGGERISEGTFHFFSYAGFWWCSTGIDENSAWFRNINFDGSSITRSSAGLEFGFSVRCVKDE